MWNKVCSWNKKVVGWFVRELCQVVSILKREKFWFFIRSDELNVRNRIIEFLCLLKHWTVEWESEKRRRQMTISLRWHRAAYFISQYASILLVLLHNRNRFYVNVRGVVLQNFNSSHCKFICIEQEEKVVCVLVLSGDEQRWAAKIEYHSLYR